MKLFKRKRTTLHESKNVQMYPYCNRCVLLDLDGVLSRWFKLGVEIVRKY